MNWWRKWEHRKGGVSISLKEEANHIYVWEKTQVTTLCIIPTWVLPLRSLCSLGVIKVCSTILSLLHAVNRNNLSASLLSSLHLQCGCTALQTARGKRPQVALFVYVNVLNMHALLCLWEPETCQLHPFRVLSLFLFTLELSLDFCFACAVISLHHLSTHLLRFSLSAVYPSICRPCWPAQLTFSLHVVKRLRRKWGVMSGSFLFSATWFKLLPMASFSFRWIVCSEWSVENLNCLYTVAKTVKNILFLHI